jgi:glutamate synthase (NADPH/NADH) large chain
VAADDGSDMPDLTAVPFSAVPAKTGLYDPANDKDA